MHNANSRKNHEMQTKAFPQFGGSVIAIAALMMRRSTRAMRKDNGSPIASNAECCCILLN